MRRLFALLAFALSVATVSTHAASADAAPTPSRVAHADTPRLDVVAAPGDTFRIVASWPASADGQTPPASYVVAWKYHKYPVTTAFPTNGPTRTLATTADTLVLPMPAYPDSMWVQVQVTATRSGYNAPTTTASKFFRRANPTPPAVPSIALDTATT